MAKVGRPKGSKGSKAPKKCVCVKSRKTGKCHMRKKVGK